MAGPVDYSKLYRCLEQGIVNQARSLLEQVPDIDDSLHEGQTPLTVAARHGHLGVVKLLVETFEADVDTPCEANDSTPLMYACERVRLDVVAYLLPRSSRDGLNHINRHRNDVALYAAHAGLDCFKLVQPFLTSSECIQHVTEAMCMYHMDLVEYLVEQGARLYHQRTGCTSSLYWCLRHNQPQWYQLAQRMLQDMAVHKQVPDVACVDHVIHTHNIEWLERLLVAGATINTLTSSGNLPLISAVMWGRHDMVALLLKHGADVNMSSTVGNTALLMAADRCDDVAVAMLLKAGANATAVNNHGDTAMALAAKTGSGNVSEAAGKARILECERLLTRLLAAGANINAASASGVTALHYAANRGCERLVRFLVDNGACVHAQCNNGKTALHMAAAYNTVALTQTLLDAGADVNVGVISPLDEAINNNSYRVGDMLLAHGADLALCTYYPMRVLPTGRKYVLTWLMCYTWQPDFTTSMPEAVQLTPELAAELATYTNAYQPPSLLNAVKNFVRSGRYESLSLTPLPQELKDYLGSKRLHRQLTPQWLNLMQRIQANFEAVTA